VVKEKEGRLEWRSATLEKDVGARKTISSGCFIRAEATKAQEREE